MELTRQSNFKIGGFHGKIDPGKDKEARIRNDLYLVGMLEIEVSRTETIPIRLIGYELPLKANASRNKCLDLLGYDQNLLPYIIEIKKPGSNEKIESAITQINGYEKDFTEIRDNVEVEIKEKFFWNDFRFAPGIGKIILSSRSYFSKINNAPSFQDSGIYICSFSRLKEDFNELKILEKRGSHGIVKLKIENR